MALSEAARRIFRRERPPWKPRNVWLHSGLGTIAAMYSLRYPRRFAMALDVFERTWKMLGIELPTDDDDPMGVELGKADNVRRVDFRPRANMGGRAQCFHHANGLHCPIHGAPPKKEPPN